MSSSVFLGRSCRGPLPCAMCGSLLVTAQGCTLNWWTRACCYTCAHMLVRKVCARSCMRSNREDCVVDVHANGALRGQPAARPEPSVEPPRPVGRGVRQPPSSAMRRKPPDSHRRLNSRKTWAIQRLRGPQNGRNPVSRKEVGFQVEAMPQPSEEPRIGNFTVGG